MKRKPAVRPFHSVIVAGQDVPDISTTVTITRMTEAGTWAAYATISTMPFMGLESMAALNTIDVDRHYRGMGFGTALLHEVCTMADLLRWDLWLSAVGDIGGDNDLLRQWYRARGWREATEEPTAMIRRPRLWTPPYIPPPRPTGGSWWDLRFHDRPYDAWNPSPQALADVRAAEARRNDPGAFWGHSMGRKVTNIHDSRGYLR